MCRRKRERLPAFDAALSQKLADFARTKEAENLNLDAGYEEAAADELSPKNNILGPITAGPAISWKNRSELDTRQ